MNVHILKVLLYTLLIILGFYFLLSAIAVLWIEFVREVRWCWEECQTLPRMSAHGSIDLSTCLINQKLHMVVIHNIAFQIHYFWMAASKYQILNAETHGYSKCFLHLRFSFFFFTLNFLYGVRGVHVSLMSKRRK